MTLLGPYGRLISTPRRRTDMERRCCPIDGFHHSLTLQSVAYVCSRRLRTVKECPAKPRLSLGVMELRSIKRLNLQIEVKIKPLPCDHSSVFVNHFDRPELIQWIIELLHFQIFVLVKSLPRDHSGFRIKDFHPPMLILWIVHLLLSQQPSLLVESLPYETASVAVDLFGVPKEVLMLPPLVARHTNY